MKIYVDGHLHGTNGQAKSGYIEYEVQKNDGTIMEHEKLNVFKNNLTSNEIELVSVLKGLMLASMQCQNTKEIVVYSDSQWTVNMVAGDWECQEDRLILLVQYLKSEYKELMDYGIRIKWIPRKQNPVT